MVDTIEARKHLPVPAARVAALFWDVQAWMDVWNRIERVEVVYDDRVHQEFVMGVERDGRTETVRTVRFRDDLPGSGDDGSGGDIHFFSPQPPPTMETHRGRWTFHPAPGGCVVSARRDYVLRRDTQETSEQYLRRCTAYRQAFQQRVAAILDSFTVHYQYKAAGRAHTVQTGGVQTGETGKTVCTAAVHLSAAAEHVVTFAREVPHLPHWSGFFTSVGAPVKGRYPVESVAGRIETWIEHGAALPTGDRLTICSLIRGRLERAVLDLDAADDGGCTARFQVTLLGDSSPEQIQAQQTRMTRELNALGHAVTTPAQG